MLNTRSCSEGLAKTTISIWRLDHDPVGVSSSILGGGAVPSKTSHCCLRRSNRKALPFLFLVATSVLLLSGCSDKRPSAKVVFVESYFSELFRIDNALAKKYMLEEPQPIVVAPKEHAYGATYAYVDQRYVSENPRLRRYIGNRDITEPTLPGSINFSVPVGMEIKDRRGHKLGKVAGFKQVTDISIEDNGDGFRVQVDADTVLDTGKIIHFTFPFNGMITGSSGHYRILSALLHGTEDWVDWNN